MTVILTEATRLACEVIEPFEKCVLVSYLPTPKDRWTAGWGSTFHPDGRPVRPGERWTQTYANTVRDVTIGQLTKQVSAAAGPRTTARQLAALISLAYNIGITALRSSTLLRMHRAGQYGLAAAQFGRWNKQAGKPLRGLTRRRAVEAALYKGSKS